MRLNVHFKICFWCDFLNSSAHRKTQKAELWYRTTLTFKFSLHFWTVIRCRLIMIDPIFIFKSVKREESKGEMIPSFYLGRKLPLMQTFPKISCDSVRCIKDLTVVIRTSEKYNVNKYHVTWGKPEKKISIHVLAERIDKQEGRLWLRWE